jgi:hypothetical protein
VRPSTVLPEARVKEAITRRFGSALVRCARWALALNATVSRIHRIDASAQVRAISALPDEKFFAKNFGGSPQKSPQWAEKQRIAEGAKSPRMSGEPGRT